MSKASKGQQTAKFKIKRGDQVMVVSGKDKGKTGAVLSVHPQTAKIVVEGAGVVKRHIKGGRGGQSGRIIERPAAIHISNVMFLDSSKKPTRVGRKVEDGAIVRVAKKSGSIIK